MAWPADEITTGEFVTADMLNSFAGAWTAWTPTWTNLTVGSGTTTARYTQIGKTVHFRIQFVFASGSAITGGVQFSLPVTAHSAYSDVNTFVGQCFLRDEGTATYHGVARTRSSGTFAEITTGGDLTNGVAAVSSTAPFTWTSTDSFFVTGTYEAAS